VGVDHGNKTGVWGQRALSGTQAVRGQSHPEAESFGSFSYKKWPKVNDLSENLPPGSEADCFSQP